MMYIKFVIHDCLVKNLTKKNPKKKRVQSFCDELQILQTYKVIQLQIQCQK